MKLLFITLLTLFSPALMAGDDILMPTNFYTYIGYVGKGISAAINNGFTQSGLSVFIDITTITLSLFFIIRSILEYNSNKITFQDLIYSKLFFVIFIFTLLDTVLFTELFTILEATFSAVGDSVTVLLTGFDSAITLPGFMFLILANVTPSSPEMGITSIALMGLMLLIAGIIMWKTMLNAVLAFSFFFFFSIVGFKILMILGLIILPFAFISELRFLITGYARAVTFMCIFSVVFKLIVALTAFLFFTGFFGIDFLLQIIADNKSVYDFAVAQADLIKGGHVISLHFDSLYSLVIPMVFLSIGIKLIESSFAVTQFSMSGFIFIDNPSVTSK